MPQIASLLAGEDLDGRIGGKVELPIDVFQRSAVTRLQHVLQSASLPASIPILVDDPDVLGADVIETDLPAEVGKLLYGESAIPPGKSEFFSKAAAGVATRSSKP